MNSRQCLYHIFWISVAVSAVSTFITGPPTHSVGGGRLVTVAGFCLSSSSVVCRRLSFVVCNAAGRRAGRPPGAWAVGRPTLYGGPVWLRPVRATPCFPSSSHGLHGLLPTSRDHNLVARLRAARRFPALASRNKKYQSFINFGLLNYQ